MAFHFVLYGRLKADVAAAHQVKEEGVLLGRTAKLIKEFPQNLDIIVSVARKTDGSRWPALFEAVGGPSELFKVSCHMRHVPAMIERKVK